jgi:RNA polymerase sigma factor (sigma-70 family)
LAAVRETPASQRDATQALWEQYHTSVYRYALSQLRSPQDAEDATQNTFLRAFNALQRGVVPENEAAWLFKIAQNTCTSSKLAWLRRRRVEAPQDGATLERAPAVEHRHDELAGLGDALLRMPARPREAFLLREWQGLSYAEIAVQMNTSQSAVETLIFRARRTLAEQLEPPLKRIRQALGLGPLLATVRGWLGGGSLAVQAAGAAAVVATASVAVTQIQVAGTPHRQHAPATRAHTTGAARALPGAHTVREKQPPAAPAAKRTQGSPAASSVAATANAAPAPGPEQTLVPVAPASAEPHASPTAAVTPPATATLPSPPTVTTVSPSPSLTSAPNMPNVPDLPAAPTVPPVPQIPSVPLLPAAPPLPAAPDAPSSPAVPAPQLP